MKLAYVTCETTQKTQKSIKTSFKV